MLLRILIILIILLTLPALYIDRCFLKKKKCRHISTVCREKSNYCRFVLWIPNVLLMLIGIVLTMTENFTPSMVYAKGIYLVAFLCIAIPETLFTLISLIGLIFRKRSPIIYKTTNAIALSTAVLMFCALVAGYFFGYKHIVTKQISYSSSDLPTTFDGYRIVQFSDMHIGTYSETPEIVDNIVDSINALKPDAVFFTGDMVNYRSVELEQFVGVLKRIKAKDGVYSVMGNHDYMEYFHWKSLEERIADVKNLVRLQRNMGWHLLLNESRTIVRNGEGIAIIGVENDGRPPFPELGDLKKAESSIPEDIKFKILLSHDPTHWRRKVLPQTNIQLMLAGHTHGMQFKVGNASPASLFYKEWGGMYSEGERALIVSTGIGQVLLPLRFGAWPEIEVITLHKR